ncbi:hypothetical protein PQR15_19480 [Streptomyces lydicus]|nr:hypothetical protein [Streptomyces lydicus]
MGCGRERQPAGPAVADGAPPPPAQPPTLPVQPPASPVGALLSRTAKGDWGAALKVAAGPTALLLVLASVAALFLADKAHSGGLGWGVRMRIALAMLLQGVGGGVSLSGNASASLEAFGEGLAGEVTLSLVPLLVTAAWAGVLAFAARRFVAVRPGSPAQARPAAAAGATGAGPGAGTAVLEAVLRVAVLCGAGAFVLGLLAQPSYDGVELSSAPFRTLLWSFLLSAVVCGAAVGRGGAGPGSPPGRDGGPRWGTADRAAGTAGRRDAGRCGHGGGGARHGEAGPRRRGDRRDAGAAAQHRRAGARGGLGRAGDGRVEPPRCPVHRHLLRA